MAYISNLRSTIGTEIICAQPGDSIEECIAIALAEVSKPERAYAYIDHNGIILTLDKGSTAESALIEWKQRVVNKHEIFTRAIGERAGIDWDKYDAAHGR